MSDTQRQVAAGWYPDPNGTPNQRWWDGTQWTNQYAPPTPVVHARFSGISIAGFVLAVIAFLGSSVPTGAWILVVVGGLLSLLGLTETKPGQKRGRGFAIAGICVSIAALLAAIGFTIQRAQGI
jgi:hypothetical protein